MKRYILPLVALMVALTLSASGQSDTGRVIHGHVADEETHDPMVGVTIRVVSLGDDTTGASRYGAVSRADGTFRLKVPRSGPVTLEARYITYKPLRLTVDPDSDEAEFHLEPEPRSQQPVTVEGVRRSRSVEDACCRVESIHEEVQQHAPFSPSVNEVLRRYSSCTSTRISCAVDNSASIRLRGLEPTYVKTLIDGLPAFSGLSSFYGLSLIPAHALQTIRISEGASSGLHGNGAISGVVDLETRPPTEIDELNLSANLSSHHPAEGVAGDFNAGYTGLVGDVGLAVFASYNRHPGSEREGKPANEVIRDGERLSGLVKGNIMLGDATELKVSLLGGTESRHGIYRPYAIDELAEISRIDASTSVAHSLSGSDEIEGTLMVSGTSLDRETKSAPLLSADQRVLYGRAVYRGTAGDHAMTAGIEARQDMLTEGTGYGLEYDIFIPSLFLQDEISLSDEFSLLGSVRVDRHSSAGTILSPRGSIRYAPLPDLTMRLMAGRGFKGEALFDENHLTFHGGYRWRLNRDFGHEISMTWNYDVSYSFVTEGEFGLDANFNAYYTTIDGKGIPHPDSLAAGTIFYVNNERPTRLTGIELQLRPSLGERWSGSLALALIDYSTQGEDGTYHKVILAPSANLDASLTYRDDDLGFTAEAWGSHIGPQRLPTNPSGLTESPAYTLANIRAEKKFGSVALFAGVLNALDTRQERTMPLVFESEASSFDAGLVWGPLEGREFFLGARLTLGGEE